jgi:hypothetical protein
MLATTLIEELQKLVALNEKNVNLEITVNDVLNSGKIRDLTIEFDDVIGKDTIFLNGTEEFRPL